MRDNLVDLVYGGASSSSCSNSNVVVHIPLFLHGGSVGIPLYVYSRGAGKIKWPVWEAMS